MKSFKYSPKGNFLAVIWPFGVKIYGTRDGMVLLREIAIANIIDFWFSPQESYLTTLARYVKPLDNNTPTKNVQIWNVKSGDQALSFTQKNATEQY